MKTLSITKAIDFYLSTRRSFGFVLKSNEKNLRSLARYAKKVHHRGPLTEKLALDWVRLPQNADPTWWAKRLGIVHGFARFWHEFDNRVQVPPSGVFGPESRRRVHLYTQNEIASLLQTAWTLRPKKGLRPTTFYTLLGLLACTGLRISEALHLETSDFDSAAGTLLIAGPNAANPDTCRSSPVPQQNCRSISDCAKSAIRFPNPPHSSSRIQANRCLTGKPSAGFALCVSGLAGTNLRPLACMTCAILLRLIGSFRGNGAAMPK